MNIASTLSCMLITDGSAHESAERAKALLGIIEQALLGGITAVMVREKKMDTKGLFEFASSAHALTKAANAALIINDRLDIALTVEAEGIHLGWRSLPLDYVRCVCGPDRLIGVSTHSPEEALRSQEAGVDYITFGPVFPTPSKEGLVEVQGLEGIAQVRGDGLTIPLVGLGGIDSTNAAEVRKAGATGVAVIRAIIDAECPKNAAQALAL